MYRDDKTAFKKEFSLIYDTIQDHKTAQIWNERLNFEGDEISWGSGSDLIFVLAASFIAGLLAKLPDFTTIDAGYFYPRNIGFIIFPLLAIYFVRKQKLKLKQLSIVFTAFLIAVIYINVLPKSEKSDTLILACIHLPLFLWALLGVTFAGDNLNNHQKRLDFLRYNGDLVVMTSLILAAGGLFTAITLGLFELIDLKVEEFYFKNIAIWGLAASPIVGTYLVQTNPQLVSKISPVIAKIFTPIVLVTLIIYLTAVLYTGKDPYNDREFLLVFNALLIGVMAIILFSITETSKNRGHKSGTLLLLGLSIVTIILNGIALSAILFRISEWGITPNRLAVLGANSLIFINLLFVTFGLFQMLKDRNEVERVERSIGSFLPIYIAWIMIVTFIFPIFFNFN
jgi:hypothetical protein